MSIFGLQDVDPLFDALSPENQDTVLSMAHGQAASFIPALQQSAEESLQKESSVKLPRVIPHSQEQLEESDFNYALTDAHPSVLRSVFVMGFTQGFCMRHRLISLDASLYSFFGDDEDETSDDELVEITEDEVDPHVGAERTE